VIIGPELIGYGTTNTFTVKGGVPPYTWRSSDPSKLQLLDTTGATIRVFGRGASDREGDITVSVTDSSGRVLRR